VKKPSSKSLTSVIRFSRSVPTRAAGKATAIALGLRSFSVSFTEAWSTTSVARRSRTCPLSAGTFSTNCLSCVSKFSCPTTTFKDPSAPITFSTIQFIAAIKSSSLAIAACVSADILIFPDSTIRLATLRIPCIFPLTSFLVKPCFSAIFLVVSPSTSTPRSIFFTSASFFFFFLLMVWGGEPPFVVVVACSTRASENKSISLAVDSGESLAELRRSSRSPRRFSTFVPSAFVLEATGILL